MSEHFESKAIPLKEYKEAEILDIALKQTKNTIASILNSTAARGLNQGALYRIKEGYKRDSNISDLEIAMANVPENWSAGPEKLEWVARALALNELYNEADSTLPRKN